MNRYGIPHREVASIHESIGQSISGGGIDSRIDRATRIGRYPLFMNRIGKVHQEVASIHESIGQSTPGDGIDS
jgi:hypothetical protein